MSNIGKYVSTSVSFRTQYDCIKNIYFVFEPVRSPFGSKTEENVMHKIFLYLKYKCLKHQIFLQMVHKNGPLLLMTMVITTLILTRP